MTQHEPEHRTSSGFTLIEVLVALIILSVGLLGLAGLQTASIRASDDAYLRTRATILSYNLIDKMRANSLAASEYEIPNLTSASKIVNKYHSTASCNADNTGKPCSPQALAQWDLKKWATRLTDLPGAMVKITLDTSSGRRHVTIVVQWLSQKVRSDTGHGGKEFASFTASTTV